MDCETCIHECVCMYDGTKVSVNYCSFYEPKRPHGEWTVRHDTMYHFECPFCKYLHQYKDNFCPLCGADLRKEGEVE